MKTKERKKAKTLICPFCQKELGVQGVNVHMKLMHPNESIENDKARMEKYRAEWIALSINRKKLDAFQLESLRILEKKFGIYEEVYKNIHEKLKQFSELLKEGK